MHVIHRWKQLSKCQFKPIEMPAVDTIRNAIFQLTEKLSTFEVTLLLIFTSWRTCSVLKILLNLGYSYGMRNST